MALVKKTPVKVEADPEVKKLVGQSSLREAEAQRRKARTLAKQQQAAERIAAACSQLASGINQAASAAEELRRAVLARH